MTYRVNLSRECALIVDAPSADCAAMQAKLKAWFLTDAWPVVESVELIEETTVENSDLEGLAHEIFAVAQLLPNEGITDAVDRIKECIIAESKLDATNKEVER